MKVGRNQTSAAQTKTRRDFYDWLAATIRIDGIIKVERDTAFDNPYLFSGGIRPSYYSTAEPIDGLRAGVLLELGFDDVTPNQFRNISSWIYDRAAATDVDAIDNRAKAVPCYDIGYTFVEKLQTISTKFRKQQERGSDPVEMMGHYYDVYGLLKRREVQDFICAEAYEAHKKKRFSKADKQDIATNEAFLLSDPDTRALYARAYEKSAALYYATRPSFDEVLTAISKKSGDL